MTEDNNDTNDNDIVPMIGPWQQRIAQDEEAVVTIEPRTASTSTNAPNTVRSKPWWRRNKKVIELNTFTCELINIWSHYIRIFINA